MTFRRIIPPLVVLLIVGACSAVSSLAPIEPPSASSFSSDLITKGAQLAAIGNCQTCHTRRNGKPYAGGRALKTPFGTIYGTNITPDPETGIGRWSEAAFCARDARRRRSRRPPSLSGFPLRPFHHGSTDDDIRALYAFVMTREPVRARDAGQRAARSRSTFAAADRGVESFCSSIPAVFQPDPAQSAELESRRLSGRRGSAIAAPATRRATPSAPRKNARSFAGGEAEGWHAPALNAASPAPVPWTAAQLYKYLRTGLDDPHAIAAGPMEPVVRNLATVSEKDVQAIAALRCGAHRRADAASAARKPRKRSRRRGSEHGGVSDGRSPARSNAQAPISQCRTVRRSTPARARSATIAADSPRPAARCISRSARP